MAENMSGFRPIVDFGGIFQGLDINFEVFTFKKRILTRDRVVCAIVCKNPPIGLTCRPAIKKGIFK